MIILFTAYLVEQIYLFAPCLVLQSGERKHRIQLIQKHFPLFAASVWVFVNHCDDVGRNKQHIIGTEFAMAEVIIHSKERSEGLYHNLGDHRLISCILLRTGHD